MVTGKVSAKLINKDTGDVRWESEPTPNTIGRNGKEMMLGKITSQGAHNTLTMNSAGCHLLVYSATNFTTLVATLTNPTVSIQSSYTMRWVFEDNSTATYNIGSYVLKHTSWSAATPATNSFAYNNTNPQVTKEDNERLQVTWDIEVGAVTGLTNDARNSICREVTADDASQGNWGTPYLMMWTNAVGQNLVDDTPSGLDSYEGVAADNHNAFILMTDTLQLDTPGANQVTLQFQISLGDEVYESQGGANYTYAGINNQNSASAASRQIYRDTSGSSGVPNSGNKLDNRQWDWDLDITL